MVLLWVGACYQVVQQPGVDKATNGDAVVVLGPPENSRIATALRLLAAGHSNQLVISGATRVDYPIASGLCRAAPVGITVTCFNPDPKTTRGEAREVRRLAAANGWNSFLVVTSQYHISRARLILGRCFSGRLEFVSSAEQISAPQWAYQYVYQTAGYLKTVFARSC